jgi:hypothetical protein
MYDDTGYWLGLTFLPNREIPEAASLERRKKQEGEKMKQTEKRDSMGNATTPIKKIAEPKNARAIQQS